MQIVFGPEAARLRRPKNMKAHRIPEGSASAPRTFEFVHRRPDCVLRVESQQTGVRIRATRGGFSQREKQFFVRHLAAEGFIPDRYCWFAGDCDETSLRIDWCVEEHSVRKGVGAVLPRGRATAFMIRLFVGASILWLAELAFLFLKT
jgi:hypothetical protein